MRLTHSDEVDLGYLIHDKTHISSGDKIHALDKALKLFRKTSPPVWRGLSRPIVFEIGKKLTFSGYSSFTESIEIAKTFAKSKQILSVNRLRGFSLWKWGIGELVKLKRKDPDEYGTVDGDFLVDSYAEEKEWIFDYNLSLWLSSTSKDGDYSIIQCNASRPSAVDRILK